MIEVGELPVDPRLLELVAGHLDEAQ